MQRAPGFEQNWSQKEPSHSAPRTRDVGPASRMWRRWVPDVSAGKEALGSTKPPHAGWVRGCSTRGGTDPCVAASSPTSRDQYGRGKGKDLRHQAGTCGEGPCRLAGELWGAGVGEHRHCCSPGAACSPSAQCTRCTPTRVHCTPAVCTPAPGLGGQASAGAWRGCVRGEACRLEAAALEGNETCFFGRVPHSSPPWAPIGSHLPPCPTWGTVPAVHVGSWAGPLVWVMAMVGPCSATQRCWDRLSQVPSWPRAPGHQPTQDTGHPGPTVPRADSAWDPSAEMGNPSRKS